MNITDEVFPVGVTAEAIAIERSYNLKKSAFMGGLSIFDAGFFTTTLSNWSTEKHSLASEISNHRKFKESLISVIVFHLD